MTLVQKQFDDQVSGTAATTSLLGATTVDKLSGGVVNYDSAFAVRSTQCGLKILATGSGSAADARWTFTPNANLCVTVVITLPAVAPSAPITVLRINDAASTRILSVTCFDSSGAPALRHIDSANTGVNLITTGLSYATRYRLSLVLIGSSTTAGHCVAKVYSDIGTTALSSTTIPNANYTANPFSIIVVGATGFPTEGCQYGYDDLQWDDGQTVEIGPIIAGGASLRPSSVVSNPGVYVNVGGAADIAAALADELDTTYAQSPDSPSGSQATWGFGTLNAGDVTTKTRNSVSAASPPVTRTIDLLQTATVISTRSITLPTTITDHQWTTSPTETATITDRTALRVRITDTI